MGFRIPTALAAPRYFYVPIPMNDPHQNIAAQKNKLRVLSKKRREKAVARQSAASNKAAEIFMDALAFERDAVIAGYWPHQTELDCRPLLEQRCGAGALCALPVLDLTAKLLSFRRWRPGDPLAAGPYGIQEPGSDAAAIQPDVVIVPLLAFDRNGYRLGYGAGFYDRTLTYLRQIRSVIAVGYAFAVQEIESVPYDHYDQPLDWIVTEAEGIRKGTVHT